MNRKSKRFEPNKLTEYGVPILLGLLLLGLTVALLVVALSLMGVFPGG